MGAPPEVIVAETADQLAERTAQRAVATLVAALAARPDAHLVITGGSILEAVLRAIRVVDGRDTVDWARVHVWWGDERYVPADSDDRNDRPAFTALLDALPLDPAHVHRMPPSDAGFADADAAAASYAEALAAATRPDLGETTVPHFDVVLLGLGPDGHCASLFPDQPGVYELDSAVIGVHNSPKPPPDRISLTFPTLDSANEIWFIASGDGKAEAVSLALGGADRIHVPSAGPRGRLRTLWLLDRAAAAKLPAAT